MTALAIRTARPDDLDAIMQLEANGFPPAIRESRDVMQQRLQHFAEGFLILEHADGAIGYLCSELWGQDETADSAHCNAAHFALGHDIRQTHRCDGTYLYISSMTIAPAHRGDGLGRRFFQQSVALLRARLPQLRGSILLLSAEWLAAHRIYRDGGYTEIARLPGFFADIAAQNADAIVMQLSFP
ncbi:MAG TPA: GNAT family N-acetyltransferase [Oxalicibacterium sp.]